MSAQGNPVRTLQARAGADDARDGGAEEELEVTFGAEGPRLQPGEDRAAASAARDLGSGGASALRGAADALALRLAHHDDDDARDACARTAPTRAIGLRRGRGDARAGARRERDEGRRRAISTAALDAIAASARRVRAGDGSRIRRRWRTPLALDRARAADRAGAAGQRGKALVEAWRAEIEANAGADSRQAARRRRRSARLRACVARDVLTRSRHRRRARRRAGRRRQTKRRNEPPPPQAGQRRRRRTKQDARRRRRNAR